MEVFGYFNKKSSSRVGLEFVLIVGSAVERTIPTIASLVNQKYGLIDEIYKIVHIINSYAYPSLKATASGIEGLI
jgi:hypothetical protein